MNSLARLMASISALIATLSLAWIALTLTGKIQPKCVTVFHDGSVEIIKMTHSETAVDTNLRVWSRHCSLHQRVRRVPANSLGCSWATLTRRVNPAFFFKISLISLGETQYAAC